MSAPSAPQIVVRPNAIDSALEFFWAPPLSGAPITGYTLDCSGVSTTNYSGSTYYAKITGLTNGTTYTFTLTATNSNGTGPKATFRSVQPGFVPDAPTNIAVSTLSTTLIRATWTNPVYTGVATPGWNLVTCHPVDSSNNSIVQKATYGSETERTITGLNATASYQIAVRTINDPGYSRDVAYFSTLTFGTKPTDVSGSNIALWLDASDLTTLFYDTSGNSPVGREGDQVKLWRDKSGNSRHFTSVDTTKPAKFSVTGLNGGTPAVQFTNGDQAMACSAFIPSTANRLTMFAVFRMPIASAGQCVIQDQNTNNLIRISVDASGGGYALNVSTDGTGTQIASASSYIVASTADATTRTTVFTYPSLPTLSQARTGTTFNTNMSLRVGVAPGVADIRVSELILYNRALTSAQRTSVLSYLSNKWALQSGGSLQFAGNAATYLSVANDADIRMGSGDFTIEWFQYMQSGQSFPRPFSIGTYPGADIAVSIESGSSFYLWVNGGANLAYSGYNIYDNWAHIAIVGTGGNSIKVYENGILKYTRSGSYNFANSSNALTIGNETNPSAGAGFKGYISNFRWTKGTAVYTSNFTVPTTALSALANTKLLLLANSAAAATTDSSSAAKTVTNNAGNVTWNALKPF